MIKEVKYLTICAICLWAGYNTSLAGERTGREMLSIAQQKLESSVGKNRAIAIGKLEKLKDESAYCIYGNSELGFVVVSRDDSRNPVLGYSSTNFNEANMPCGLKWWLNVTASVETPIYSTNYSNVQPHDAFITTKWGQDDPYNFMTPVVQGNHAPSGCVATAMAQILKHYEYPAQGKGSGYYMLDDNDAKIPEKITTVYEWDKLQNEYPSSGMPDEDKVPIASLLYDAGLAAGMNYKAKSSGAQTNMAAHGLAYNFSYDSLAIRYCVRSYYNDSEWMEMIYNELSNGRPVFYAGIDENQGGHAFVLDGVDADGLVHVNWGWNGEGNGYFDIAELNPKTGNVQYRFNLNQEMLFGFRCDPMPTTDEEYQSLWCTSEDYSITLTGKLMTLNAKKVYNYHFLNFNGTLGIAIENVDGHSENNRYVAMTIGNKESAPNWGLSTLTGSYILTNIPQGNYHVYLASKALQDSTPQPVRSLGGIIGYTMQVDADGKATLSSKAEPYITAINAVNKSSVGFITRYYDLQGRELNGPSKGLVIRKQGNTVRKVIIK